MDNITHTLTAVMMSKAGLNRWCPRATAVAVIAANAPDVDFVSAFAGDLGILSYHRGETHSVLWMPVVALLPLVLMLVFARKGMRWVRAYMVSLLVVATHIMLDATNIYGVRLFAPISDEWFHLDIASVIDLLIITIMLLGAGWLLLSRIVSSEMGARAPGGLGIAIFVLTVLLVVNMGRYVMHQRAIGVLEARLYAGAAPVRVAAFPQVASPFRWRGLVETGNAYMIFDMDLLRDQFNPEGGRSLLKSQASGSIEAARETDAFQRFLQFSKYPLWRVTPMDEPSGAAQVQVMDLRFGLPGEDRFAATAMVDRNNKVLRSWFQYSPPGVRPRIR